ARSAAVTARSTPRAWSAGVDGVFAVTRAPSTSATRSVNVPPTSTPSLARSMIHLPLDERYSTTAADQWGGRSLWRASMTTLIAPHSQSPASRFGSSLLNECSEVGCHHVKFAAWLSPWTRLQSYRRYAGRRQGGPPGRRCMHRHSTGSEPARLVAGHPSRPTT